MKTCPFCSPNVEKASFAENENFMAVYNIAPVLPGHILIVPRQHITRFLDIDDSLMVDMIAFSRKVIKTLQKCFHTDSYDWTIQEGIEAGQSVEHMHIHIIPRTKNDLPDPGDWYPKILHKKSELIDSLSRPKLELEEMKQVVDHLKITFDNLD